MSEKRNTGAFIHLIDESKLGLEEGDRLDLGPLAYAEDPDGHAYVLCTEGVGWEPIKEGKHAGHFELPVVRGMGQQVSTLFATPAELTAVAADETDLSTFIRSFGSRLEVNFGIWFRKLTGKEDAFDYTR